MSYWDILPLELHDIIYRYRDEIIAQEKKRVIESLSVEELFQELSNREGIDLIKTDTHIFKLNKYNVSDFYDAINLGINLHRSTSVMGNETNQMAVYYDNMEYDDQWELAIECYDNMNIDIFDRLLGDNQEFVNISEWCYSYLKRKWYL